jgi:hypothetical protein
MRTLVYKIVLSALLISCNSISNRNVIQENIDSLPVPNDSATVYFPTPEYNESKINEDNRYRDSFAVVWCSKMLFAMHEPVLYSYHGKNEIYRFTLLRSYDHPIMIRLQKRGDSIKLFSKVTSGEGGYEPGHIMWDTTFDIKSAQFDTLNSLVDKANFWNIPTEANGNMNRIY